MSNPDDLFQEAKEMAATWTAAHQLERDRRTYFLIPMPETHDELCREADATQYLDYARQTPLRVGGREVEGRSVRYRGNDYRGYAAGFVQEVKAAWKRAAYNTNSRMDDQV